MFTVYILECADQTLYTGCTNNVEKRLSEHNTSKTGAKYTRARRPVKLVYVENKTTRSKALVREAAIKRMTRAEKLALISKRLNPRSGRFVSVPQIRTRGSRE